MKDLIDKLPADSLAVYALESCAFAARAAGEPAMAAVCERKLRQRRKQSGGLRPYPGAIDSDLTLLTESDLVALHAAAPRWYDRRRARKMEPFTRTFQWRIIGEFLRRDQSDPLARLLLQVESLEAAAHARHLGLSYRKGDRPRPFNPSDYPDDEALIRHIRALSRCGKYIVREELIEIADHIQTTIVDAGTTADHIALVSAILSTDMPSFNYPDILRALEKATATLTRTRTLPRMQLAPAYYTLWNLTLKPTYLNRFQNTVRHCYYTLARHKTYPDLGVDPTNPLSLTAARQFLSTHHQTLWTLGLSHSPASETRIKS